MRILIGVDEAGYGPNLGPLVVAATAWRVEGKGTGDRGQGTAGGERGGARAVASPPTASPAAAVDLYKLLRKAVVRSPAECARRLAIADSKALYKAGLGLRQLERGVLAALAVMRGSETLADSVNGCLGRAGELILLTGADPEGRRRELACHEGDELALPCETEVGDLAVAAKGLSATCGAAGVGLVGVRARLVYPAEFNDLVDRYGTKGAALSHVTLALVRSLIDSLPTAHCPLPTFLYFDKHGGRNAYGALVQHHFPESWIRPVHEGRAESRYEWEHAGTTIEAVFRVGCESMLPTALASMTAKYHRELAMRAFNAFWAVHVPGLRPTAGYPGDARRFKGEIADVQRELGIDDRALWRSR